MWLNNIILTQDDLNNLDWVSGSVSGIDSGDYEVLLDGKVVLGRYLVNGSDHWTLQDVPPGNHTICARRDMNNEVCKNIFIQDPLPKKYGCIDNCSNPSAAGTYDTQAACKAACPDMRGYECKGGSCVQTDAGTGTLERCKSICTSNLTGLSVNGKQGSVSVALNTPVTIKISGIGANKSITLTNVSTTPDTNISEGVTDGAGNYTTTLTFSKNEVLELRGYYNCLFSVCANETNTVTVIAGVDTSIDYLKWALIIIILIVIAYYSKELGIFKAIKKR